MEVKKLIVAVAALITCTFFIINLIFSKLFKSKDIIYKCKMTKNTKAIMKLYGILLIGIPFIIAFISSLVTGEFASIFSFIIIWYILIFIVYYNVNTRIVITSKGIGKVNLAGLVTLRNLYWDNIKSYEWNNNLLILNGIINDGDNLAVISIANEDKNKVDSILSDRILKLSD